MIKVFTLALMLSLSMLMVLPGTYSPVRAVNQTDPSRFSPFGPREKKLTITDYSFDPTTMFTAFQSGQIDITDSPIQTPTDSAKFCSNPDFYCTSPAPELLILGLDINHRQSFLGASLQQNRTVPPASFVFPVTTGTGCGTGFGQLTVYLQNQEQGNAAILDPLNKLVIANQPSGSPSATAADSGGSNPTGTYTFPCILAGIYKITSSIYSTNASCSTSSPTSCITVGSGQSITATFLANWNSPSTKRPSQAGAYVGRALGHLLDKPSFVSGLFGNTATYVDEQVSPAQRVVNLFPLSAECSDHLWFDPCNPVSAYNFVSDNIVGGSEWWTQSGGVNSVGPGYSGVSDLRAACDDFVKAGFTVVNGANATDCGDVALASIGNISPGSSAYPHLSNNGNQIGFIIRSSFGRKQLGIIIADSINFLFGTPNNGVTFPNQTPQCTVTYNLDGCPLRFPQIQFTCVFSDTCSWNLYTPFSSLDPTADQFYFTYHSSFSSNACGGQNIGTYFIPNYMAYCDPQLDTYATAGEFSPNLGQSNQFSAQAALVGALNGLTVPVLSPVDQFAALNGWNFQQCNGTSCADTQSSIVNGIEGTGPEPDGLYWTLLNARQVPGYVPSSPSDAPGGGDHSLIRLGFSGPDITSCFSFNNTQNCADTFYLSPFSSFGFGDGSEIIRNIFDSMLQANPMTGGTDGQIIDWQTTSHSSSFNPNEVGCNLFNGCVAGTTTQLWHLRNDLFFQDGKPVTANDVAYTIIAYRDVPSTAFQGDVFNVVSATPLDCGVGQACKTLQVKLQGQSPQSELNIGTLPIIPKHIWAPYCGDPPGSTSQCASGNLDPMSQGIMIGDGPWQCAVPAGYPNAGHVGGSCTVNPDGSLGSQTITPGGKILLTRYGAFARCCPDDPSTSLYKLSYTDHNNDGVVNILDLADVASHYGQPDPYWVNSNIGLGATVNAQDLATVAIYYGHGTTYPFLPSRIIGLDPQIDPFFCPPTGC